MMIGQWRLGAFRSPCWVAMLVALDDGAGGVARATALFPYLAALPEATVLDIRKQLSTQWAYTHFLQVRVRGGGRREGGRGGGRAGG